MTRRSSGKVPSFDLIEGHWRTDQAITGSLGVPFTVASTPPSAVVTANGMSASEIGMPRLRTSAHSISRKTATAGSGPSRPSSTGVTSKKPCCIQAPATRSAVATTIDDELSLRLRGINCPDLNIDRFIDFVSMPASKARFPSVDAPFQARENVGVVAAHDRMLSSVRPWMRQEDSRWPVWDSRTGSRSPIACSKHSGKPWLSQPRLADCCAILSFRSPSRPRDRRQPTLPRPEFCRCRP